MNFTVKTEDNKVIIENKLTGNTRVFTYPECRQETENIMWAAADYLGYEPAELLNFTEKANDDFSGFRRKTYVKSN